MEKKKPEKKKDGKKGTKLQWVSEPKVKITQP